MGKSGWRDFECPVVKETVRIRLTRRPSFDRPPPYSTQCDQIECQYVEQNEPPCPLNVGMFAEAIREIEERRRQASSQ
jgi:hypothetical protein